MQSTASVEALTRLSEGLASFFSCFGFSFAHVIWFPCSFDFNSSSETLIGSHDEAIRCVNYCQDLGTDFLADDADSTVALGCM